MNKYGVFEYENVQAGHAHCKIASYGSAIGVTITVRRDCIDKLESKGSSDTDRIRSYVKRKDGPYYSQAIHPMKLHVRDEVNVEFISTVS